MAKQWSYGFNTTMGFFVCTLDLAHWIFFYTYFECGLTMKYVLERRKVPRKLAIALMSLNIAMITFQVVGPIMTFIYAQQLNNYYFAGGIPDVAGADSLVSWEEFWLSCTLTGQIMSGLFMLVAIVLLRILISKKGNPKMIDDCSFIFHLLMFFCYIASVVLVKIWNDTSAAALHAQVVFNPIKLRREYLAWQLTYYWTQIEFYETNMLVQLFTIWIFIGLTVKEIEPVFERLSVYEESIKRISVLETDKL
jgi:hypothetical protein